MSNFKKNRIINKKLLKQVKKMPCLVCTSLPPNDPHHVKSVGSGGDDTADNLMPLCRTHHTEVHKIGLNSFSSKYVRIAVWLAKNNWSFNSLSNKWQKNKGAGVII